MRFGVLGPLAVWTADGTAVSVPEALVRRLLAALLVGGGGPVSSERLVHTLWSEGPPTKAGNALQAKVSRLRSILDAAEAGGRKRLSLGPAGYRLALTPADLDSGRFSVLTQRARSSGDPRSRIALLNEALTLWRGPVVAEFRDEPFVLTEAERLDDEWLAAIEELAEARLGMGDEAAVAADLADPAARYPFRERLRALRMRALYRSGQQAAALDIYHDLRLRLSEELGVDPSPEVRAVYHEVLDQGPAPVTAYAPPTGPPHGNLPAPLTDLVGREEALSELPELVTTRRLVTLVGTGGVGKTRLATATAGRSGMAAWFVELAGLDAETASVHAIAERVAGALGAGADNVPVVPAPASHPRAADMVHRLASALAGREALIVLDNCEHLVESAAVFVQTLLAEAPGLRVIATSREPLGLAGETVWTVHPLGLPPAVVSDAGVLTEFASAQLFLARVADAVPEFRLGPDHVSAVAAICRQLDGIPLALELAAGLTRSFTPEELSERLSDRFRLLAAGKRGVPARQQTLRAVIDWSWILLGSAEQAVLRRLSVHRDGCTLAAAEAVCSGGVVAKGDVPALLGRLVDQSLVLAEGPGETRYGLLESVAAYARERLTDAGEAPATEHRHRTYYRTFVETADPLLRGPDQCAWLARLDAESANTRAALDNAIASGHADDAQRLAVALAWYHFLRGRRQEALSMLDRALRSPGTASARVTARARAWRAGMALFTGTARGEPNSDVETAFVGVDDALGLARARWFLAHAEFGFGSLDESEELLGKALTAFGDFDDQWGTAAALGVRATQALFRGETTAIHEDAERSAELFTDLGDQWGRLFALSSIGIHHEIMGATSRADEVFTEAGRIAEELELWPDVSTMLARRGRVAMLEQDYQRADPLLERARAVAKEHADVAGQEFADIGLAMSARRQGRPEDAEPRLLQWLPWNREVEADYGVALILAELGFIAEEGGDAPEAKRLHHEGLVAAHRTGDPRAVALAMEGLAGAASLAAEHTTAAELLGTAHAAREFAEAPLPAGERGDVDRITSRVRAALGADGFADRFAEGARQSWRRRTGQRAD